jgi:hypothetical protein
MPALPFSKLDGPGPELDRHHYLAGGIGLPPGPDRLLFGGGLPLAVYFYPSLDGPGVGGVLQEQLLLLQLRDELGPARLDGIIPRLGKSGERE